MALLMYFFVHTRHASRFENAVAAKRFATAPYMGGMGLYQPRFWGVSHKQHVISSCFAPWTWLGGGPKGRKASRHGWLCKTRVWAVLGFQLNKRAQFPHGLPNKIFIGSGELQGPSKHFSSWHASWRSSPKGRLITGQPGNVGFTSEYYYDDMAGYVDARPAGRLASLETNHSTRLVLGDLDKCGHLQFKVSGAHVILKFRHAKIWLPRAIPFSAGSPERAFSLPDMPAYQSSHCP